MTSQMVSRGVDLRQVLRVLGMVVGALALVGVFVAVWAAQPSYVAVTLDNPTDTRLHVTVASGPEDGVLPLGSVAPQTSKTFSEVFDQGETWVFAVGRNEVREVLSFSREEMESMGWTVRLPFEAAERVEDAYPPVDIDGQSTSDADG